MNIGHAPIVRVCPWLHVGHSAFTRGGVSTYEKAMRAHCAHVLGYVWGPGHSAHDLANICEGWPGQSMFV